MDEPCNNHNGLFTDYSQVFYDWNNESGTTQVYYSQHEYNMDSVYHQYNHIYSQLKPIMSLASRILAPDVFEHFQNRLDIYENNINYLESLSIESDMNCAQQYYNLQTNHYSTTNGQLDHDDPTNHQPVEYLDLNNNIHGYDNAGFQLYTLDTESYGFDSEQSYECTDHSTKHHDDDRPRLNAPLDHAAATHNPDSSSNVKKKRRKKGYTKKSPENNEKRVWYRCGWESCSFGSYYNGVVKRHSFKKHCGQVRIAQSESDAMHRFKCDWPGCDVSLVAYHKLVEHKRRHTGEKPFGCKWKACQYSTGRLYSLIIHERVHKAGHF